MSEIQGGLVKKAVTFLFSHYCPIYSVFQAKHWALPFSSYLRTGDLPVFRNRSEGQTISVEYRLLYLIRGGSHGTTKSSRILFHLLGLGISCSTTSRSSRQALMDLSKLPTHRFITTAVGHLRGILLRCRHCNEHHASRSGRVKKNTLVQFNILIIAENLDPLSFYVWVM